MVVKASGARQGPAKPGRKLVAAYLRVLGAPRPTRAFRSLREEIEPRLHAVVADALAVRPEQLSPATSLVDDLAADSLDVLDLMVRIEDEFEIVLPEREMTAVDTYADLADVIVALVACRLRAEDEASTSAPVEVRMGSGDMPRFVRVLGREPYDREVLRDDLRLARTEPVDVNGVGNPPPPSLERTLVRARFDGADVRTPDRPDAPFEDAGSDGLDDLRSWPASRLVVRSLALVDGLRAERDLSLRRLVNRSASLADELATCRGATDDLVVEFRAVVETYLDVLENSRTALHEAARKLGRLGLVRRAVDERAIDSGETGGAYDAIVDALLSYVHALPSKPTRLPPRAVAARSDHSAVAERDELRA